VLSVLSTTFKEIVDKPAWAGKVGAIVRESPENELNAFRFSSTIAVSGNRGPRLIEDGGLFILLVIDNGIV
jgi:hypothetical protein